MWKVYCGKSWIGIIETNFVFAENYWKRRSSETGKKFKLVYVEVGAPFDMKDLNLDLGE